MIIKIVQDSVSLIKEKFLMLFLAFVLSSLFYVLCVVSIYSLFNDPNSVIDIGARITKMDHLLGNKIERITFLIEFFAPYFVCFIFYYTFVAGLVIYIVTSNNNNITDLKEYGTFMTANFKKLLYSNFISIVIVFSVGVFWIKLMDFTDSIDFLGTLIFSLSIMLLIFSDLFVVIYKQGFIKAMQNSCLLSTKYLWDILLVSIIINAISYSINYYFIFNDDFITGNLFIIGGFIFIKSIAIMIFQDCTNNKGEVK